MEIFNDQIEYVKNSRKILQCFTQISIDYHCKYDLYEINNKLLRGEKIPIHAVNIIKKWKKYSRIYRQSVAVQFYTEAFLILQKNSLIYFIIQKL